MSAAQVIDLGEFRRRRAAEHGSMAMRVAPTVAVPVWVWVWVWPATLVRP